MRISVSGIVDRGMVREKNDDRLLMGNLMCDEGNYHQECGLPYIASVCDGVGGYEGGDRAAAFVISKLLELEINDRLDVKALEDYFKLVNEGLVNKKINEGYQHGMRTTVCGLILTDERVLLFNAGDSRIYRLRNGLLRKMTEDHSVVQEKINQGVVYEDAEFALAKCSQITRYLGDEDIQMPDVVEIKAKPLLHDVYLLCSDGLWAAVNNDLLKEILSLNEKVSDLCDTLYRKAIENKSEDNISICIIQVNE